MGDVECPAIRNEQLQMMNDNATDRAGEDISPARYFIYLSYDGSAYHGWQIQPNGISVQQRLNEALTTLLRTPTGVTGAGRTDAGVHAKMMVAHFDAVLGSMTCDTLADKLNRLLPGDIAIDSIVPVRADAHARFDATSRTYHYYITRRKSPFAARYRWRVHTPLDMARMNEAARLLTRYTDFTSFSRLHTDTKTNNCRITLAEWRQTDDGDLIFVIRADRFLRNMVRAIVGTLYEVGRGRMDIEGFTRVIEGRDRCLAGSSAPGNALFLSEITYPQSIFIQ